MILRNQDLVPKNGQVLTVIRVARISTLNQDERSLDDQLALLDRHVRMLYSGIVEYTDLATQGSGETLDRAELNRLEQLIVSEKVDLVISEDLARICRRMRAIDFCELCEDHNSRLIAINDRVDTAEAGWRDGAFMSSWHHERSNTDTSNRIKRSLRNRFQVGKIFRNPGPFYIIPEGAKTIQEVQKNPDAKEVVELGFKMLEDGRSYSDVADMLNNRSFPVGKGRRTGRWNGVHVKEHFLNPRLKGKDVWNKRHTVRVNKTGRRKSVPSAPEDRVTRDCPHLAFISEARFDALAQQLQERNSHYQRAKGDNHKDPLQNRPRKRTRFPGQLLYCGVCGRKFLFGGHGQTEHLMCQGARDYKCWNGITVDGPLAARKIAEGVLDTIELMPAFEENFLTEINRGASIADSSRQKRLSELNQEIRQLEMANKNLLDIVSRGEAIQSIGERIRENDEKLMGLRGEQTRLQAMREETIEIPDMDSLRDLARQALQPALPFSWEFNQVMQRLIPKIVLFPYRLIDGGTPVHRAQFRLRLGEIVDSEVLRTALRPHCEQELSVDLFDPPQREEQRIEVVRMRQLKVIERTVAARLGITVTAAQRANTLQRLMNERGLTDPYQALTSPPRDYTKLRRYRHVRYKFDPLPDAGQF